MDVRTLTPLFFLLLIPPGGNHRIPSSILHGGTIPPSLLVPASVNLNPNLTTASHPTPSPSEQLSTYLRTPVQLIRTSPLKADQRKCEVPPGLKEAEEWVEGVARMREVGKGVGRTDGAGVEEEEDVVTGFADGYPLLIANEGKSQNPRSPSKSKLNLAPLKTLAQPMLDHRIIPLRIHHHPPIHPSSPTSTPSFHLWHIRNLQIILVHPIIRSSSIPGECGRWSFYGFTRGDAGRVGRRDGSWEDGSG